MADDTEARSLAGGATVADDSRAPLGLTSVVVTEPLLDVVTMVVSPLADEVELTLLMGNEADPEAVNLGGGASGVGDVTADRAAFNDAEFYAANDQKRLLLSVRAKSQRDFYYRPKIESACHM